MSNYHASLLPLLQHHAERARRGVRYNALRNCHAAGVDSIVLHDEPGNRVRLFVARDEHTLWRNRGDDMSIAIHPHHCDVRLVALFGTVYNDVYALTPHPTGTHREMHYVSGVGGEPGSLTPTGERAFAAAVRRTWLSPADALRAHELHTIFVPKEDYAAWLVIEGAEDPDYKSTCWTTASTPFESAGFYEPMKPGMVAACLETVVREMELYRP